jgi:hypothetical protein
LLLLLLLLLAAETALREDSAIGIGSSKMGMAGILRARRSTGMHTGTCARSRLALRGRSGWGGEAVTTRARLVL